MKTIEWLDVGPVSAERDRNLKDYFYDAGVSEEIIQDPTRYLILGRKGAGKTAVFLHLRDRPPGLFSDMDVVVPLSTDDFVWRAHRALGDPNKSSGAQYRDSWRLVIAIEAIRGVAQRLEEHNATKPKSLRIAHETLARLFGSPIPKIGEVLKEKIFSLAKFKLPSLDVDPDLEKIQIDGGEISFSTVEADNSLKATLSQNIEHLTAYLERQLIEAINDYKVFLIFDRVDDEWLPDSVKSTRLLIGGLLHAAEYITEKSDAKIRPIVFLREDIFESLDTVNDKNKLRMDCSRTLMWDKNRLEKMVMKRINFFGSKVGAARYENLNSLFTSDALTGQDKNPLDYIYFRTFCRPRDVIAYLDVIIREGKSEFKDSIAIENADGQVFGSLIQNAEGSYSDYLYKEIEDEWLAQKPIIGTWLSILSNLASRKFSFEDFQSEYKHIVQAGGHRDKIRELLRFLFESSIIGYAREANGKVFFNCFSQSRKFEDAPSYFIHKGLVVSLGVPDENL